MLNILHAFAKQKPQKWVSCFDTGGPACIHLLPHTLLFWFVKIGHGLTLAL